MLGNGQANCDGTTRSYRFRGWVDPVTQERQIECLNEIGSCKERFRIFELHSLTTGPGPAPDRPSAIYYLANI